MVFLQHKFNLLLLGLGISLRGIQKPKIHNADVGMSRRVHRKEGKEGNQAGDLPLLRVFGAPLMIEEGRAFPTEPHDHRFCRLSEHHSLSTTCPHRAYVAQRWLGFALVPVRACEEAELQ